MTDLIHVTAEAALDYLTEGLRTLPENKPLLRPSLEAALLKLGHDERSIKDALDKYENRIVH